MSLVILIHYRSNHEVSILKIAIIGNGFDLRHKMKTGFDDFIGYFKERNNKNIIVKYFDKINACNGWLDFEQELLNFFIHLSKFRTTVSFQGKRDKYIIDKAIFIKSPETMSFYHSVEEMEFEFFSRDILNGSVCINDDNWQQKLIKVVLDDFQLLKESLRNYLREIQDDFSTKKISLKGKEIQAISDADRVFTFNYTNTIDKYLQDKKVHYVHGSLEEEIILGIPYSNEMNIKELQYIFKTSQSIKNGTNTEIYDSERNKLEIFLIGFSFGESDHYFFQEVKDWITRYTLNDYKKMPPIYFNVFYYKENAISDYLYNFRKFLGEEMLTRFDLSKRLKFISYD